MVFSCQLAIKEFGEALSVAGLECPLRKTLEVMLRITVVLNLWKNVAFLT